MDQEFGFKRSSSSRKSHALCQNSALFRVVHLVTVTRLWQQKTVSLPHQNPDIHSCSHKCPQARAAFLLANYKKTFTPKIKDWTEITYTDGSVIKHNDGSLLLSGSGVYKPGRDTSPPTQHLQLHMKPNGRGPIIFMINTINRAELAGILVVLQQGQTDIASDSASCLSQTSKQTLNPMRMRYHRHAELIRAISTISEHSSRPIHFYK
eukprot:1152810-Pelagomonas_calceolata.AAC.1